YFSIIGIVIASVFPAIFLALGYGYTFVGLILAIISGVSFYVVFFTIKEKPVRQIVPKQYTIIQGILQTFKNKTFDGYIIAKTSFTFGFYFFLSSLGYIVERVVMPGNPNYSSYVGIFTLIALVFAIILSPLLVRYSKRHGEKSAFVLFTSILALAFILIGFVGFTHIVSNFTQTLFVMAVAGLGLTSYFILPNAILSEVVDEDETMSGYRREGLYFGVQGLIDRVPTGLAGLVLGRWVTVFYNPAQSVVSIRALPLRWNLSHCRGRNFHFRPSQAGS
ncbi:MAG: MFS transporter, partial [Nitrososphaerota archaeon]